MPLFFPFLPIYRASISFFISTPLILLQKALGLPTPAYLHTPLVLDVNGEKLSKQNGAAAVDLSNPLMALNQAAQALGLPAVADSHHISVSDALAHWVQAWSRIYNVAP